MKYLKILGLAAVAAAVLMAFVGAGTASAAVLCSTTTTPCGSKLPIGTKIGFESEGSFVLHETAGETLDTCKKVDYTGELTKNSSTETATGPITTFDLTECTWTTTAIELGKFEVTGPLTGTSNGTLVADSQTRWTISIPFFGSCVYGFTPGRSLGTLTEGNPATWDLSAVVSKLSGSAITCPETTVLTGKFQVNEPANTTIAVEPS